MKKLKHHTIDEFLTCLSQKTPTPGGGSAAALTAAQAMALISMVTRYSQGKSKSQRIETRLKTICAQSEKMRKRLATLVDLDAQAYWGVVKSRTKSAKARKAALKKAIDVPAEVCRLCYQAIKLTPFLVKKGNPYLLSDVEVALELLLAAYHAALINIAVNKK